MTSVSNDQLPNYFAAARKNTRAVFIKYIALMSIQNMRKLH
jgi:hypothetical protein